MVDTQRGLFANTLRQTMLKRVGLGCFFCWLWTAMQNPTAPAGARTSDSFYFTHWIIVLVSAVATFATIAATERLLKQGAARLLSKRATIIALAAYALSLGFPLLAGFSDDLLHPVAVIATGALSAWLFVRWGTSIGPNGPRELIALSSFALMFAFILAIALYELPAQITQAIVALLPFASAAALQSSNEKPREAASSDEEPTATSAKSASLKFFGTLLIQGMAFGLLHYLYGTVVLEKCDDPYCPLRHLQPLFPISVEDFYGFVSIIGLALAAGIILVAIKALRLNFRKLLYVVGFPLMALGFLIIGSDAGLRVAKGVNHASGLNFVYGEVIYVSGYYYVIVIAWALCAHLGRTGKESYTSTYTWSGLSLLGGQLIGFLLSALTTLLEVSRSNLCFLTLFALMLSSLLIVTNDTLWAEWGGVKPSEAETMGTFRRACASIADAHGLTPRETEVFNLVVHGRSMAHIAESLVISRDTVKTHCRSIYHKLGIHSQQEAINLVEAEMSIERDQRMQGL